MKQTVFFRTYTKKTEDSQTERVRSAGMAFQAESENEKQTKKESRKPKTKHH